MEGSQGQPISKGTRTSFFLESYLLGHGKELKLSFPSNRFPLPWRKWMSVTEQGLQWACAKQKKSKTRSCRPFENILWTLCQFLSTSVLPGCSHGVWYRDAQMSNRGNSRPGSSTAPAAQGSAWTSAVVFFQEGGRASTQCPTALWGHADLLESAPGLSVTSSIVQHRHPLSNILQITEEASPSVGNSAPSAQARDKCLKSKVIVLPPILCALPKQSRGKPLKTAQHPRKDFPTAFVQANPFYNYIYFLELKFSIWYVWSVYCGSM